jgi:bifunctional DNA-binding transcriptional regulator/antitoxin component of YhaV-PrlF toxin-antitoxin module
MVKMLCEVVRKGTTLYATIRKAYREKYDIKEGDMVHVEKT